ncbi:hypothetical protein ACROAD_00800 [Shewanella baltica]|uniref:hypothetical protein n=1 Tax=Shewanella TaxID=22 RepID=UPI003D79D4E4
MAFPADRAMARDYIPKQPEDAGFSENLTHFRQGHLLLLHKWHSRHPWRLRLFADLAG